MTISLSQVEFGEIDAKNEVFRQRRSGKSVFFNAFQIPPGISLDGLLSGDRYFILGQKGCGKTALLLYFHKIAQDNGHSTETTLFRSGISEAERQQIVDGSSYRILDTPQGTKVEYDFLFNWLWYIYANFLTRIEKSDVSEGHDILDDLRRLIGIENLSKLSSVNSLSTKNINSSAKINIKLPFVSGEISGGVDLIREGKEKALPVQIIQLCERYIGRIKIKEESRYYLSFDELEVFSHKPDQRERDLTLIKDLLLAVSRFNHTSSSVGASLFSIASIRSEILNEVNELAPEIARDVEDFGVEVDWNVKSDSDQQPILNIIEARINASEIEEGQLPSDDVWSIYFEDQIFNKDTKSHLLDISMFKPRLLITHLNYARSINSSSNHFNQDMFTESSLAFSTAMWREISEQLLQNFPRNEVANLKSILTGWRPSFYLDEVLKRAVTLNTSVPGSMEGFRTKGQIFEKFALLYEAGAVGNRFYDDADDGPFKHDRWHFRGYREPLFDRRFAIHGSLRKMLQIPFDRVRAE